MGATNHIHGRQLLGHSRRFRQVRGMARDWVIPGPDDWLLMASPEA
jgi:hypothetical protein